MKYKLVIELLSDMCPASGEVYNSLVDTDIDYDSYGFPYLSAKRVKGCLRETAQILNEWGKDIPIAEIFGKEGNERGNLRLGSAKIEHYQKYKNELDNYSDTKVKHPQNVLALHSYIRTQTAMENGVAKKGSLRVLRVLKKGLIFEAKAELDKKYEKDMEAICKSTRNMGVNRTRGLGEVKISIEPDEIEILTPDGYEKVSNVEIQEKKTYRLSYRLKLLEPAIFKSSDKGQEKTQDYIEGAKMLGVIAGILGNEEYREMTKKDKIICSNLYITDSDKRYYPVEASLRKKKNDNSKTVYNLAAGYNTAEQTQSMGNLYILEKNDTIKFLSVSTQIRYHHSRPMDKSVGRALGDGNGELYQLSSILEGQVFAGFIQTSGEVMKKLISALENCKYIHIGYGRASEYGKTEVIIDGIEAYQKINEFRCSQFAVRLLSPIIMYNESGMCTQDVNTLADILSNKFGIKVCANQEKMYLKHTVIGGWQTMWNKPKQTIQALDKGTILIMRTENQEMITIDKQSIFVGERTVEGYGEIMLLPIPDIQKMHIDNKIYAEEKAAECQGEFISKLLELQERNMLIKEGRRAAQKLQINNGAKSAATVNMLLLALKEQNDENGFRKVCISIKDCNKKKQAENILKQLELKPTCKFIKEDEAFKVFMKYLLREAKYRIRTEKRRKSSCVN